MTRAAFAAAFIIVCGVILHGTASLHPFGAPQSVDADTSVLESAQSTEDTSAAALPWMGIETVIVLFATLACTAGGARTEILHLSETGEAFFFTCAAGFAAAALAAENYGYASGAFAATVPVFMARAAYFSGHIRLRAAAALLLSIAVVYVCFDGVFESIKSSWAENMLMAAAGAVIAARMLGLVWTPEGDGQDG